MKATLGLMLWRQMTAHPVRLHHPPEHAPQLHTPARELGSGSVHMEGVSSPTLISLI